MLLRGLAVIHPDCSGGKQSWSGKIGCNCQSKGPVSLPMNLDLFLYALKCRAGSADRTNTHSDCLGATEVK